jgi:hypothetical protein
MTVAYMKNKKTSLDCLKEQCREIFNQIPILPQPNLNSKPNLTNLTQLGYVRVS